MIKVTTEMHGVLKLDIYVIIFKLISSKYTVYIYNISFENTNHLKFCTIERGGRRCRDRMKVGFRTPCSISAYHH